MRDIVLFDFGGTLDADGDRWAIRFHDAYAQAGGRLPFAEFEPLFREADRRLEGDVTVRTMGFGAMIVAQTRLLRALVPDTRRVAFDDVARRFHLDSVAAVRRNRVLLDQLASRYRLGVVSNFTGNLDRCLAELELLPLFSVVADSLVVGCSKPDPGLFRHALSVIGAPPERAWMVGDNFEADIRPAASLGLATCWLAPATRPAPTDGIATRRIARLVDLAAVLA